MKIKLISLSFIILTPFIQAAPEHQSGFDSQYVNENSNMWPFDRDGKIFNFDNDSKHFDFLKNTVYDEKDLHKVVGRSWNRIHWSENTVFTQIEKIKDFSSIKGPVIVRFFVSNPKEVEKMSQGVDFISNKAKFFLNAKNTDGIETGEQVVVGLFTPDSPTSGTLLINSKPVKVKTTWRAPKISTETLVTAKTISQGYWKARITGAESSGKFMAKHIELEKETVVSRGRLYFSDLIFKTVDKEKKEIVLGYEEEILSYRTETFRIDLTKNTIERVKRKNEVEFVSPFPNTKIYIDGKPVKEFKPFDPFVTMKK